VSAWVKTQVYISNRGKLRVIHDQRSDWPSSFIAFSPTKTAEWHENERYESDDGSIQSGNARLVLSCKRCRVDGDQGTYVCFP